MSFDYLNDLFGKFRIKKETSFSEIENKAKSLLKSMYNNRISYDEFAHQFGEIIIQFQVMVGNVIDENTPLWLNQFGANVFLQWRDWYNLRKTYQTYPEKFNTPELKAQYKSIESMNYDEWLMSKIKYCLNNL